MVALTPEVGDCTSASPTASRRSSTRPIAGSSTSTSNPSTSRRNAAAGARSSTSRLGRQLKNSITATCYGHPGRPSARIAAVRHSLPAREAFHEADPEQIFGVLCPEQASRRPLSRKRWG